MEELLASAEHRGLLLEEALTSHSSGNSGGGTSAHLAAVLGGQKALELEKVLAPLLARRRVEDFSEAFGGRASEPPGAGDVARPAQTLHEQPAHAAPRPSASLEQHAVASAEAPVPACSRVRGSLRSALALSRGELLRAEMEETLLPRPHPEQRPSASAQETFLQRAQLEPRPSASVQERAWAERASWAERPSWVDRPLLPDRPAWGVGPGLRRPRSAGQVRGGWR